MGNTYLKKTVLGLAITSQLFMTACASSSDSISAAYVSPIEYQSYNCNQIEQEVSRVSRRVQEIAGVQDAQAQKDAVALGVGLVVFWPALFFMIGKDKEEELARLKGEYEALEQMAIEKECSVVEKIEQAKKEEAKRKEEEEEERRRTAHQLNN